MFLESKSSYQEKYNLFSTFRIVLFLIGLIALIYFSNKREILIVEVLIFVIPTVLGFFIKYHSKIKYKLNQAIFLAQVNQDEIDRLNLNLTSFDKGQDFQDP